VNAQRALALSLSLSLSLSDCTHIEALYHNEQPQAVKALQRNLDANFGRSGFTPQHAESCNVFTAAWVEFYAPPIFSAAWKTPMPKSMKSGHFSKP